MKKHLTLILILISCNVGYGQILNHDFEVWQTTSSFDRLENWYCNGLYLGACRKVMNGDSSYAVRMDNSLPCVDSNNPVLGASLGHGDLKQIFKVPASEFILSYDLVVDTIDMPAEFQIRLISPPGYPGGQVFTVSYTELFDGHVTHEISIDPSIDSLVIEMKPIGHEKAMPAHDCDLGYISASIDNVRVDRSVNTKEIDQEGLLVYPNPSQGALFLKSNNWQINRIEIYDLFGRRIKYIPEINSNEYQLNLDPTNGFVYLKLLDAAGNFVVKKVAMVER